MFFFLSSSMCVVDNDCKSRTILEGIERLSQDLGGKNSVWKCMLNILVIGILSILFNIS